MSEYRRSAVILAGSMLLGGTVAIAQPAQTPAVTETGVALATTALTGGELSIEVQPFTDDELREIVDQLKVALEASTKPASPDEDRNAARRRQMPVRATFGQSKVISRGLESNRSMTAEQVKKMSSALAKLKEKFPKHAEQLDVAIFKVEKLTIGREAPNIKGVDTDKVEFQLKDYRGKIVVVDFWGDW